MADASKDMKDEDARYKNIPFPIIAKTYKANAGNLALTAEALGIDRSTLWQWRKQFPELVENPGADDPCGQVDLTPEAKIGLPPLPKIKMTPVDIEPPGDFICIFGFRFGRRGIKPKKHEYKVKKHSPVSRIGNGNKKHQQCF